MQGHSTGLCLIVTVGPLPDGSYRRLTDLDKDVPYLGDTYVAATGMQTSAFVSSSDLGVDNAELDSLPAFINPLDGFTKEQVMSGALDGVAFSVRCISYEEPWRGAFIYCGGTIGEQRIKGTAMVNLEQRSITNKLKQNIVESDSIHCRAPFGSQALGTVGAEVTAKFPCTYDYSGDWVSFTVDSVHPTDTDLTFYTNDFAQASNYFRLGMVKFSTGDNAGQQREVASNTLDAGEQTVTLAFPFPRPIQAGDTGQIRWGCDKLESAATGCARFFPDDWNLRYRGERWLPSADGNALLLGASTPGSIGGTGENPTGTPAPIPNPPSGGTGTPGTPTARSIGADTEDACAHGADPDASAADNVTAINAAIAALAVGGGEVYFSVPGTYNVTPGNTSGLIVLDRDNTRLNLDGVTLRATYSSTVTAPATHRDVIRVDGATEWEIAGGTIIGYLDTWVSNGGATVHGISEWAHGIYVTDSASAGSIYSITTQKCVGDGVSIGRSASDIYIGDFVATNCRRQGISTGGDDIVIEDFDISYIGTTSPPANGPWAGIDVEVDSPDSATNITIRNGRCHHNKGPGVLAVVRTSNITIEGVTSDYNQNYGILLSNSDTGTIKGCTLEHNKYHGVKAENDSDGWTIGGATSTSADKNRFFNNNTSLRGLVTTGSVSTLDGESTATRDHINTEDGSAVTVDWNDFGP